MIVVGILEDNLLFRKSIENFLLISGEVFISFSEPAFSRVAQKKYHIQADLVIVDIHLEDVNGVTIIKDLKKLFPHAQIMVVTADPANELVLKAVQNGANSYIIKPFSFEEFNNALSGMNEHGSYMQPAALTKLMRGLNTNKDIEIPETYTLTTKEVQILKLIKEGFRYKEVANTLQLGYHIVNNHLKNIYIKFNVKSRSQLVGKYIKNENKITISDV